MSDTIKQTVRQAVEEAIEGQVQWAMDNYGMLDDTGEEYVDMSENALRILLVQTVAIVEDAVHGAIDNEDTM
jgi:hypothetical protein